jgi:hypothetical protein
MNTKEVYFQEDLIPSGIKEALIIEKEKIEEKIMINKGMNSKVLHHKEDHFLPGIKVSFWVIVLHVIILDINMWISKRMEEMFKQYILMFPPTILNATNATTMDT